jgi:glutamate racemase
VSLKDYLLRHPEMAVRLSHGGLTRFLTTESADNFTEAASIFFLPQYRLNR